MNKRKKSQSIKTQIVSLLHRLDDNLLFLLSSFLIVFIPLYPKIPLFSPIEQYIVRVRLEDIFILIACIVWLIQFFRKKINWDTPVAYFIFTYILISFLSVISAIFLIKTVPLESIHLAKTLLHFFRYIEYFALFFIVYSSIKSKRQVKFLIFIFSLTILAVMIYGVGQKYYYWPVYSTMNREFSKGLRLYLTEHARVQSTFAGHYDLSAYLLIALLFTLTLAFKLKKKIYKVWLHLVHLAGLWLMVVSASRTSFISYLFGLVLIILIISWQKKDWKKRIKWGLSRSLILAFLISVMMLKFGTDMYERFLQTLGSYPKINYSYHQLNAKRKNLVTWIKVQLKLEEKYFKAEIPKNAISLEEAQKLENVLVESDQRPVPQKPSDVYVDVPDYVEVATISAEGKETTIIEARERTWSANAIKHGLSLAIRLDELWPRAIQGFMRNPLLGSGYATLNKEGSTHFTEAESTDNNFLRTLGETGLLGFLSFYGVILLAIYIAAQFVNHKKTLLSAVSIAFIVASISLLVNAIYIDVYAASKVAYTYWTLVGLTMAYCYLGSNKRDLEKNKFIKFIQKIRKSIVRDVRKSKS